MLFNVINLVTAPTLDTSSMVALLASLLVVLMVVIGYLYKQNNQLTKEHKEDLKLFKNENLEDKKELIDALNKIYLNYEKGNLVDKDFKEKLERIIVLLQNLKDKS